ncbi:hypothetical protein PPRY_a3160 [Pseudoalteromonas prydzensis ACAM 620]|nr:hypothetical protein [Pseudoalteromonas prydzensis ACAM 620]
MIIAQQASHLGGFNRTFNYQAGFIPELTEQLIINLPITRKPAQKSFPK